MSNTDIAKIADPLARARERLANHGWQPRQAPASAPSTPPSPLAHRITAPASPQ
jgi:hypothetical protein